ncbi:MAG: hypothetical protein QOJ96_3181 [Alphaproteobacteria bacterium]|jgi:hypothetical protein|nr:hypothetical protein [Alphaproteobacteria bacterium]
MELAKKIRCGVAAGILAATSTTAGAAPLVIAEVNAPAVNCVFRTNCILPVTDSIGPILLNTGLGTARLQSRTFTGTAGTPGAGKTGYLYRVDMTKLSAGAECIAGLTINFGPVTKLPYKNGQLSDIFVITAGGLGTIGPKSADQFGNIIVFNFSPQLCVGTVASDANTTFFFGLAAATAPVAAKAHLFGTGTPPIIEVDARAPTH